MSPQEVANLKNVDIRTVRRILRDAARRAAIFPGATSVGEGKRKLWNIPADEAKAWQPNYSKQRPRR
ncbi:MAG: hypothetical protein ACK4SA_20190 [Caldilinea sp.]